MQKEINTDVSPLRKELLARGKRLAELRDMLGFNRAQFSRAFDFGHSTIDHWEKATTGSSPGINKRNASRIVRAVETKGLIVALDWLLYGKGNPPYLLKPTKIPKPNFFHTLIDTNTIEKIALTQAAQLPGIAIAHQVNDEATCPYYEKNDWVIGLRLDEADWHSLDCTICLLELADGKRLIRKFVITARDTHVLTGTNDMSGIMLDIHAKPAIKHLYQIIIHYRWGQP